MSTLDRSDWLSNPYTKELIEHLKGGQKQIEEMLGMGNSLGDDVGTTALAYSRETGKMAMLYLTLDYIEHGLVEEESEETPGNTVENYDDEA